MSHARQNEWTPDNEGPAVPTATDVFAIHEQLDIAAAARLLRDMKLHYLLVADHGSSSRANLIGVLTEGDIVAVVAREADPRRRQRQMRLRRRHNHVAETAGRIGEDVVDTPLHRAHVEVRHAAVALRVEINE